MEDRIEVGEYVRTKDGRIAQIKSIDYEAGIYRFDRIIYINDFRMKEDVLYSNEMFKKVIVKHRKKLADLIKVGDYINGQEVLDIYESIDSLTPIEIIKKSRYETFISADKIKTILTKEQFEANCYKVGEDDE